MDSATFAKDAQSDFATLVAKRIVLKERLVFGRQDNVCAKRLCFRPAIRPDRCNESIVTVRLGGRLESTTGGRITKQPRDSPLAPLASAVSWVNSFTKSD
jgi:hypothetical protein